jgi:hypothetical protein
VSSIVIFFDTNTDANAYRKILRGFDRYQRNTGSRHALQPDTGNSRRAVGKDALTDESEQLWQG